MTHNPSSQEAYPGRPDCNPVPFTSNHRRFKMNTTTKTLSALTGLALVAGSADAGVLLGGFDGTNNAGPAIQDASVAGLVTVTLSGAGAAGNFGDGSGLWGTTDLSPDPDDTPWPTAGNSNVIQLAAFDIDLTVTNNSAFDLTLEQIHINVRIDSGSSDTLHDITYVSGDLAETDGTLIKQVNTGPGPNTNMVGYSTSLAGGGITDLTLASGESATIRYSVDGSGTAWVRADNFAISGSLVPEPGSLALLGLGGLCVLRRRRG